jgi:hypothetical protein
MQEYLTTTYVICPVVEGQPHSQINGGIEFQYSREVTIMHEEDHLEA